MRWLEWVAVVAVLLVGSMLLLARANRRAGPGRGSAGGAAPRRRTVALAPSSPADHTLVGFVVNPTKPGVAAVRDAAARACAARHLPEPLWFETTAVDPGVGQAREAVDRGAELVVAIGGDGTVRAVAEALVNTAVPMGLVPQGTGNLLARNLDLPLGDVQGLLQIALAGRDRRIDVGRLTVLREDAELADATNHIFLVIAGIGFDAAMVADADEDLKAKVGWMAYFFAGIRHLHARRMRLEMSLDDSPWYNVRLRSVLIGNCGRLPGGITLLPDAVIDDGWLDIGALDTRGGLVGWGQLFGEVALQRFGVRSRLRNKIGRIDHARVREIRIRSRDAQQVQLDGDVLTAAVELMAGIEKHALTVRVPHRA